MSAIAVGEGADVAEPVGELTIPPTITTIRNKRETVPNERGTDSVPSNRDSRGHGARRHDSATISALQLEYR